MDAPSRRRFLSLAAATSAAASTSGAGAGAPPLPTVRFGKTDVTRLIIGSNPFYGYSHFNRLLDQFMREYMTQDRRMEILARCSEAGVNTWQLHYSAQSWADFQRYRGEGGKMNWFLLGDGDMMKDFSLISKVADYKPVGIAHHGNRTDEHFRAKEMHKVREFCKAVRDAGVMVGVSTHNPAVVDWIESAGWDIDYYMTCLYRVTRTREEARAELGEAPLGETFLERDPERMCRMIRATKRPCLAFKILAAGRKIRNPEEVEASFRFVYSNIKPGDAVIVGMLPRFKDEIAENAAFARKWGAPGAAAQA